MPVLESDLELVGVNLRALRHAPLQKYERRRARTLKINRLGRSGCGVISRALWGAGSRSRAMHAGVSASKVEMDRTWWVGLSLRQRAASDMCARNVGRCHCHGVASGPLELGQSWRTAAQAPPPPDGRPWKSVSDLREQSAVGQAVRIEQMLTGWQTESAHARRASGRGCA